MSAKKTTKKGSHTRKGKQASLFEPVRKEKTAPEKENTQVKPFEMELSPIIDKKSYDNFIKVISLRIYSDFERSLKSEGIEKPELSLVGFNLAKVSSELETKMANYVCINSRLIMDRAFVDVHDYAARFMPRVIREMHANGASGDHLPEYVESKVQRDIMMEIRAIALQHIPDEERYSYANKLKEF
ncbi:hypothetical protein CUJ83_11440 [Methanocella sp. CWC-04]|uniref:Uncharacterized protein n=1 Tax=Methanooceanicella nereidis TaxID=2052831 RepID=A0AAP2REC0_9EURY|nr:hypothetical protein [Methanocella sp. CWC-04]MCD1295612.1 hypothetical protein [Methanocella sp. CWC-04]